MQIDESLQRILSEKHLVIDRFYERFLERNADARRHFVGVDMRQQAVMLTMALITVESHYSESYPATEHYLKVLGHRHYDIGVNPELYPKFCDCLLVALADFHGNDWDEELAKQWHQAIDKATKTMLKGYDRAYIC